MPVPRTILLLLPSLPSFARSRLLGDIYHQVGILLSSCSSQLGSWFWFGVVATFESICLLCDAMMVFMFGMHEF